MLKLKQLQNKSLRKYKTLYEGVFLFCFLKELIAVLLTLMFSTHTV